MILISRQRKEQRKKIIRYENWLLNARLSQRLHIILQLETIEINQAKLEQYDLLLNTRLGLCRSFVAAELVVTRLSLRLSKLIA